MTKYPVQKDTTTRTSNPESNRTAIAPYNFIELPNQVVHAQIVADQESVQRNESGAGETSLVRHDSYFTGRHTGHITCLLVTDSPLYIRTGLSPEEFAAIAGKAFHDLDDDQKQRYTQFFARHGTPTIPGSSLRGMLRTLLEIVGHSKVTRVTDRRPFFRTLTELEYNKYFVVRLDPVPHRPNLEVECYGTHVRTGFLCRKSSGAYVIKECASGRIKRSDIPDVAGKPFPSFQETQDEQKYHQNRLYKRIRRQQVPDWDYQHHTIYVQIDQESDHFFASNSRHKDMYLRYRAITQASFQPVNGLDQGVLVLTGHMQHKKMEFVFLTQTSQEYPVPDDLVRRFHDDDQISQWQEMAFPQDCPQPNCRDRDGLLRKDLLRNSEPVFFLLDSHDTIQFFGRAQNFRLPYPHSPHDFVPAALRDAAITDLAEAMFGYVPDGDDDKRQAYAGRVCVDDALLTQDAEPMSNDTYITPRILGSPKPTTFQHYLVQPGNQLQHYACTPEVDSVIRGHKFYWHQEQARLETLVNGQPQSWVDRISEDPQQDVSRSKQHTGMQPLPPDTKFKVCIRFENLSDVELGALIWLTRLASDAGYRLKLGMGKPLGMGSVRLEHVQVVCSNRQQRYAALFDESEAWATGENEMKGQEQDECVTAFQQYVLQHSGLQAPSFDELPRVHMLRWLLAWPGPGYDPSYTPEQDQTRYMEIERPEQKGYISGKLRNGKANEYANRPVLPGPWQVMGAQRPVSHDPVEPHDSGLLQRDYTRQEIAIPPKKLGIIENLATAEQPGHLQDEEGRSYPYLQEDMLSDITFEHHQRVLFRVEKRKLADGKRKKGREKKWKPCAVDIEPYIE